MRAPKPTISPFLFFLPITNSILLLWSSASKLFTIHSFNKILSRYSYHIFSYPKFLRRSTSDTLHSGLSLPSSKMGFLRLPVVVLAVGMGCASKVLKAQTQRLHRRSIDDDMVSISSKARVNMAHDYLATQIRRCCLRTSSAQRT